MSAAAPSRFHVTLADGALQAEAREARTFWQRTKGLLGVRGLPAGEFLWIRKAPSIHTFGMTFSLDLIFLDRSLRVVNVYTKVPPGRIRYGGFGADSVLEAETGWLDCAAIRIGDAVVFSDVREVRPE